MRHLARDAGYGRLPRHDPAAVDAAGRRAAYCQWRTVEQGISAADIRIVDEEQEEVMFSRARMTDATQRVTIGVDPGQSGAVAVLADGEPVKVFDMPCTARKNAGHEVSAAALAIELRA